MTMQLKTVPKLLVVLISFVASYSAMAQDSTITCEVPTVETGQQTQLICDFKQDISALNSYVATVEFYPPDIPTPVEITECRAVGGSKSCKEAEEGYTVDQTINTHMYINITQVSPRNVGRFLCKVLSPETNPPSQPCFFYLQDATTDAPERRTPGDSISVDSSDNSEGGFPVIPVAAGAGGGVVLLATIVIVVFLCKRKSSKETKPEHGEEDFVPPFDEDVPPPIPKREPIILESVNGLNGEPYETDLGEGNPLLPVSPVDESDPPPKPPRLSISSPGQGEEDRHNTEQMTSPDAQGTDEPPESNDTAVESSDVFEPPSES